MGAEPLRVHGMNALNYHMFVNLVALAIRSRMTRTMKESKLIKKYSVQKMLIEMLKIR